MWSCQGSQADSGPVIFAAASTGTTRFFEVLLLRSAAGSGRGQPVFLGAAWAITENQLFFECWPGSGYCWAPVSIRD